MPQIVSNFLGHVHLGLFLWNVFNVLNDIFETAWKRSVRIIVQDFFDGSF
jgi:hypothetical protein